VLVFRNGEVTGELSGQLDQDNIIQATFGVPRDQENVPREKGWAG
jgi:hypothetical protein